MAKAKSISVLPFPEAHEALSQIGMLSFALGVVVAVLAGLYAAYANADPVATVSTAGVLFVFGTIVGLVNVVGKGPIRRDSIVLFLLASITLTSSSGSSAFFLSLPEIGKYFAGVITNVSAFVVPTALIIAAKAIWDLGVKLK